MHLEGFGGHNRGGLMLLEPLSSRCVCSNPEPVFPPVLLVLYSEGIVIHLFSRPSIHFFFDVNAHGQVAFGTLCIEQCAGQAHGTLGWMQETANRKRINAQCAVQWFRVK